MTIPSIPDSNGTTFLTNLNTDITDINSEFSSTVPTSTTVNGHALSSNVTVTKNDVGLSDVQNINYTHVNIQTQNYSLQNTDNGSVITLALVSTVIIPDTLTTGFSCIFIQKGTGQITFTPSGNMVLYNRQGFNKTAGQHACVSIIIDNTNSATLAGDCA